MVNKVTQATKKSSKYSFTMKNVNLVKIYQKYGFTLPHAVSYDETHAENTTKLSELNPDRSIPEFISFLDESKRPHLCIVSMIDFRSKKNIMLLKYHCYWCRNPFDNIPIGCPIKYVSSQVEKKYHSRISRDVYTISENITKKKRVKIETEKSRLAKVGESRDSSEISSEQAEADKLEIKEGEYYETDGIFCSFNCCKSWIRDNKHNKLYVHSETLLTKLYNDIMGTKMVIINPAPHWRLLEHYGGNLNIIKFREGFNKIDYEYHGHTKQIPRFAPIGFMYEEKLKF